MIVVMFMGECTVCAVLPSVLEIEEFPSASVSKSIQGAVAEQAVKIFRIRIGVAGKIFTVPVCKKGKVFHQYFSYNVDYSTSNVVGQRILKNNFD